MGRFQWLCHLAQVGLAPGCQEVVVVEERLRQILAMCFRTAKRLFMFESGTQKSASNLKQLVG